MPSAARLVAAICLAALAVLVSFMIMPLMPESTDFGYFVYVNAAIGLICGWRVMGPRAGHGTSAAITNGLTGTAVLVFWGLFVQGCNEMFRLAMDNRYGGAFEALMAIFEIGIGYAQIMMVPQIILTLLVGGVLSGLATETASRLWR